MEAIPLRYSLRQLRYFVVTAEVLSFTAAAKQLHVSQPSISSALADLEEVLGVQLFIRHHAQGLSLTQAGQDLLGKARDLLKSAEELQEAAQELDLGATGTIALGCMVSLAPPLLPALMSRFLATHAGIGFRTFEGHQENLLQNLRNGLLDVALTYDLDLTDELEFEPLLALPPYAILPRRHALASRRSISLAELASEPYIMLDLPHSREYFASLFADHGTRPIPAFKSAQPEVVRGMVANGLGFSILNFPLQVTRTVDGQEFAIVQFREKPRPMTLGLVRSKQMKARAVVRNFTAFCRAEIGQFAAWKR